MNLPFALPDWIPEWITLALAVAAIFYGLVFIAIPFSVFGVKGRLEAIERRLDDIHLELRAGAPQSGEPPAERAPRGKRRIPLENNATFTAGLEAFGVGGPEQPAPVQRRPRVAAVADDEPAGAGHRLSPVPDPDDEEEAVPVVRRPRVAAPIVEDGLDIPKPVQRRPRVPAAQLEDVDQSFRAALTGPPASGKFEKQPAEVIDAPVRSRRAEPRLNWPGA